MSLIDLEIYIYIYRTYHIITIRFVPTCESGLVDVYVWIQFNTSKINLNVRDLAPFLVKHMNPVNINYKVLSHMVGTDDYYGKKKNKSQI